MIAPFFYGVLTGATVGVFFVTVLFQIKQRKEEGEYWDLIRASKPERRETIEDAYTTSENHVWL